MIEVAEDLYKLARASLLKPGERWFVFAQWHIASMPAVRSHPTDKSMVLWSAQMRCHTATMTAGTAA